MRKTTAIILALLMICALALSAAACGKSAGQRDDEAQNTEVPAQTQSVRTLDAPDVHGEVKSAGNIHVLVPEGWVLVPGGPGGSANDNSAFIYQSESAGSPYIWVSIQTRANIESSIANNSSDEIEPFMLGGVKWQGKSGAFYGEIDGELYIILLHPSLSYDDAEVLAAAASLG